MFQLTSRGIEKMAAFETEFNCNNMYILYFAPFEEETLYFCPKKAHVFYVNISVDNILLHYFFINQ